MHDEYDEDQVANVSTAVHDRRRRARYVPDRPVNAGNSRSLPDSPDRPAHLRKGQPDTLTAEMTATKPNTNSPGLTATVAAPRS